MADNEGELSDLVRWSEALSAIARTGLGFSASLFERERFTEILHIAADIKFAADARLGTATFDDTAAEWLKSVGDGMSGYVTPRVAIGALVGNEEGELLLVQRSDSGIWLYPTGWADVGYSATEVAVKEVEEETGILVAPVRLAMLIDGLQAGLSRIPLYSMVFQCKVIGGELKAHPLECLDVGFFARDALPEPLARNGVWVDQAFDAINGKELEVMIDLPRDSVWRS